MDKKRKSFSFPKRNRFRTILFSTFLFGTASLQAQDVKVMAGSVENDSVNTLVRLTAEGRDKWVDLNLENGNPGDIHLRDIRIHLIPGQLIPDGIPYLKGTDLMNEGEGQMIRSITGQKAQYRVSHMYLVFKLGKNDYLLAGLVSWNTFLCNITTANGRILITGDGDNKQLKPGKSLAFEKIVLMKDSSWQDLMDRYAGYIARENKIQPPGKHKWKGWSTWDFYKQFFLPGEVESNMLALKDLVPNANIIQLDGGWWKQRGDYLDGDVREDIPGGIKAVVEKIHAAGYKAGLHFDGMRASRNSKIVKEHPEYFIHTASGGFLENGRDPVTKDPLVHWDYSHPGARAHIKMVMRNARENWGVDYFKIDFLRSGLAKGVSYLPVTSLERFKMGINAMKEGFGKEAYFLTCSADFGSVIGLSQANRMGADIHPDYAAVKARVQQTASGYFLQSVVFNTDPDYLVLRGKEESSERDGKKARASLSLAEAAMWSNYVALYGNARIAGDNLELLKPEKKELLKQNFHLPFFTRVIPLDLWDHYTSVTDAPGFFLARAEDGTICLAIFNWDKQPVNFEVKGLGSDAKLESFGGKIKIKADKGVFLLPMQGIQSVLLKYKGGKRFEDLRKHLELTVKQ